MEKQGLLVTSGEIPSLDGWRAVAIGLVFISHAGLGHIVPGGLGVTIFFLLSGFLITTLMLREIESTGKLNFKNFYIRRLLRLSPPLILVLVVVYALVYAGALEGNVTFAGIFSQLFYFANYFLIFFDGGEKIPLGTGIFWSLAVEEHFYFFFPALLVVLLNWFSRRQAAYFLSGLCFLILLWRVFLATSDGFDSSRTYFATDTRIDSILFGCILALWWSPKVHFSKFEAKNAYFFLFFVIVLLGTLFIRGEFFRETLRYTVQGVALIFIFKFSISNPDFIFFRFLNLDWVKMVGFYSYSIYLTHYVVIQNLKPYLPVLSLILFSFAISMLFAYAIEVVVDSRVRVFRSMYR